MSKSKTKVDALEQQVHVSNGYREDFLFQNRTEI